MNQYLKYRTEDFIWDDSFRQWVLTPTRESNLFWNRLREEKPELIGRIRQAREVVLALAVQEPALSDQEITRLIQNTLSRSSVVSPVNDEEYPGTSPVSFYRQHWIKAAASIVLLLGIGMWFRSQTTNLPPDVEAYQTEVTQMGSSLVEKINSTESPLIVELEEGSKVTLLPGSRLSYQSTFRPEQREVYLLGEAFFEITSDPNRPFMVYANELVTRVLGTSFWVKAREGSKKITVEVKTGRVSVYPKPEQKAENDNTLNSEGVVLYPNQKIIYARKEIRMLKTLVEKPEIVAQKPERYNFVYEDSPMSQVFRSLEKAYGVDIVYDEKEMKNCPLTAFLTGLTLYEKLGVICKAIGARYEIIDGKVVIQGKGCKN